MEKKKKKKGTYKGLKKSKKQPTIYGQGDKYRGDSELEAAANKAGKAKVAKGNPSTLQTKESKLEDAPNADMKADKVPKKKGAYRGSTATFKYKSMNDAGYQMATEGIFKKKKKAKKK